MLLTPRVGFALDAGEDPGPVEGRVNAARRAMDQDQAVTTVARDEPGDDATGQLIAIPAPIASDDDAHAYSIASVGAVGASSLRCRFALRAVWRIRFGRLECRI